jgi:hypothetical protein
MVNLDEDLHWPIPCPNFIIFVQPWGINWVDKALHLLIGIPSQMEASWNGVLSII